MASTAEEEPNRRDFIVIAGSAFAAVGGAITLWPFIAQMNPDSSAQALASKDQEWLFWTVQQTMIFPVLLLAGMMLPIEGAPRWLQVASDLNPLTYVVEAARALFAGSFPMDTVAAGFLAAALVAALGLWVGVRSMARSS